MRRDEIDEKRREEKRREEKRKREEENFRFSSFFLRLCKYFDGITDTLESCLILIMRLSLFWRCWWGRF
jgi:hypothetical protein